VYLDHSLGNVRQQEGERNMNRRPAVIATVIIVNACMWGLAMLMSAHTLRGTGAYQEIQLILSGCTVASLVVVGGGLAAVAKKAKQGD